MASFADYRDKYSTVKMSREDGILELTFHTDGGPVQWGVKCDREWGAAFNDIANDSDNRVVIMTGTGDRFSGPEGSPERDRVSVPPEEVQKILWSGTRLLTGLLSIEAPVISAVNGPAVRHAEIPLLADVVLAADNATFQDSNHFRNHLVPGDGMHIVMPMLLGPNRGRYFLLTGQTLTASQAYDMGLVGEVLPRERLLSRAREVAQEIAKRPYLVLRYSRLLLTHEIKRQLHDLLGYGLALEGIGMVDRWAETREETLPV
jgi:enoyl-CoA hydratase/carnithine racemase